MKTLIIMMSIVLVLTGNKIPVHDFGINDGRESFPVKKVPPRNYEEGLMGTYSAVFGWDGDKDAAITFENGSFLIRDGKNIMIDFNIFNSSKSFKWYNHSGYLPCLVTEFEQGEVLVKIMNFGDKVTINGNDYVIAYSRVSATNRGTKGQKIFSGQSVPFIPLNTPDRTVKPQETVNFDFAIAIDRFGKNYPWPRDVDIQKASGWDEHFRSMKSYWDDKLSEIAQVQTPNEQLNNAYKPFLLRLRNGLCQKRSASV